jgi:hypothetical protein
MAIRIGAWVSKYYGHIERMTGMKSFMPVMITVHEEEDIGRSPPLYLPVGTDI